MGISVQRAKACSVLAVFVLALFTAPTPLRANERTPVDLERIRLAYETNNVVELFDSIVFSGEAQTEIFKPAKGLLINHFGWSKTEALPYVQGFINEFEVEVTYDTADKSGSVMFLEPISANVIDRWIDRWSDDHIARVSSAFSGTLSERWIRANHIANLKAIAAHNLSVHKGRAWSTCSHTLVDVDDQGTPIQAQQIGDVSLVSVLLYKVPNEFGSSSCLHESLMYGLGVRSVLQRDFSQLYVRKDGVAYPGKELSCFLKVYQNPAVVDGMSREEALAVVSEMQANGVVCD